MADTDIKEAKLPTTTVKHTKDVPISEVQKIYYASKTHTEASRTLSEQYGFSDRCWRYALRKLEEKGFLEATSLPETKLRDLEQIAKKREENKIPKPKPPPKKAEKEPQQFIMLTVWFRVDYTKIGAKGYHPFFLQGFYSRVVPRDTLEASISDMMNYTQDRLEEFRALVGYLEFDKTKYVEGIETEELDETHHHDSEFKYNYGRNPL